MNTQIMLVLGEPCVITWYDERREHPIDLIDQATMDRSIVYDRTYLREIGVPIPEDDKLSHAVLTFRERMQ